MRAEETFRHLLEARVPEYCLEKLLHYAEELERWSRVQSLVRYRSRRELVERHLLESLSPLSRLPQKGSLLDIGSGAGFPGIPLLCALPQWQGVLLEPRSKKWAFLRQMIRELDLAADARCEPYQTHRGGSYSAILSRALAGHLEMTRWSRGRLAPGGSLFFWATEREETLLRGLSAWNVLGFPIDGLGRGRLIEAKKKPGPAGKS